MIKNFKYGYIILQWYWKANGIQALLSITFDIYNEALYPFIQVFLLAKALDIFTSSQNLQVNNFAPVVIVYIIASVINIILFSFQGVKDEYVNTKLDSYIDVMIAEKLVTLDPATFENPEFQNLLSQIDGIKGTIQAQRYKYTNFIKILVRFTVAFIVVSTAFPFFAPLILIATIPSYLVWDRMRIKTWPFFVEKRSLVNRVVQYVKSLLSADATSKEAIIFKTGPVLLSKVKQHQKAYYKEFNKALRPWTIKVMLARMFQFCAFVIMQYVNFSAVIAKQLSIGQFTLIFQQTLNLTTSSEDILNQYSSIAARGKYLDKFFDFLKKEKVIQSTPKPVAIPQTANPPIIECKNVSFRYPKTERYILKNFNLTINSGEKVALVGENGAGKSTLIKLLLRFYDISEGEILINGVNIKEVNLEEWHTYIGALFQDFIKYQFTFEENIYYGDINKKPTEELLKKAIDASGASGYIDDLPKRYKQVVGKMFDDGIDLSGGQWQKLALARAFFRNAPILILDEPTSAIDAKAEYEIFEKVQHLQKDKTVIIISHRFSTVRNADRIFVLDNGKIIEKGNHKQLMQQNGLYAELFNIQAQGYK